MKIALARLAAALLALCLLVGAPPREAHASQGSVCMPTTGTVSGLTFSNNINTGLAALLSSNSGNSAPANDCTAAAVQGQIWLDTSNAQYKRIKFYDGTSWLTVATLDVTNHIVIEPVGGGAATIASAATTDLWSTSEASITVSGTTTITALANASAVAGTMKMVRFSGALTLTHNATSLILPTGANITTAAGDAAIVVALTSTNVAVIAYTKANGQALSTSSVFTGATFFNSMISPAALAANTNNWNPTDLATANTIRFSCSNAINITGLTAPATDGQVLLLDNIGSTNTCTLTNQDTNSTAANRFSFDRPIPVRPGRAVTIRYDATLARWRLINEITAPGPTAYSNLRVFNQATVLGDSAPTTPDNQFTIKADYLTVVDTNGGAFRIDSLSSTIDITASGADGLDTGARAADTWYSIWAIYNPSTGASAGLFSTSATSPTMPSGYTAKKRIGWTRTDGSGTPKLYRIIQYGNDARYVVLATGGSTPPTVLPKIWNGTAGSNCASGSATWTAKAIGTLIPSTAVAGRIGISNTYGGAGVTAVAVAPNGNYGSLSQDNIPPINVGSGSAAATSNIMPLESTDVYACSNGAGGAGFVYGWIDSL